MSTIKDVARVAGVSPSTVSRVLSGDGPSAASEETKKRIWAAVREVNYSVNEAARELKKKKDYKEMPKVAIDCIIARELDDFFDPLLSAFMHEIEAELFKEGYRLRCEYGVSSIREHITKNDKKNDAAVILGRIDKLNLDSVKSHYEHIIYVGLQDIELDIDSVICRGTEAVRYAMNYLISLGHRRICYVGETRNEQRYDEYIKIIHKDRQNTLAELTVDVPFTSRGSYDGLCKALEDGMRFTAVLCANDVSAVGVLRALKEHGLSVPRDVSLVAINDVENVRYLEPMITTVAIPTQEIGKHVARILVDRMKHKHMLPVRLYIPSHLCVRDSCMYIG